MVLPLRNDVRLFFVAMMAVNFSSAVAQPEMLEWSELPAIPDEIGLAGPFAGAHNDALIVAGGANFPRPVWESEKVWHDRVYVMIHQDGNFKWRSAGKLPRPIAYGVSVSIPQGVLCIGGNNADSAFSDVFLLSWNDSTKQLDTSVWPSLPHAFVYSAATVIGDRVFLTAGQSSNSLESATAELWSLDLTKEGTALFVWEQHADCPGPARAFHLSVAQHNGYDDCLYVMSGRCADSHELEGGPGVRFLTDVWEYNTSTESWRERASMPHCMMAGTAFAAGQSHVMVSGGADGTLYFRSDVLQDSHPGFPLTSLAYHTITNTWTTAGKMPANQVTTVAVPWGDSVLIPSGEVRPRVRSPRVWKVSVRKSVPAFGATNYVVLSTYLGLMVAIGWHFSQSHSGTDQYFRGGKNIPWWAAGCSIFATMLSSLTFTGVPSKSFAQDWVYLVGNCMIPVVAFFAVRIALPFFRRIDATSAYEYLELRFNRTTRVFGSACFVVFHVFRMAVVMSLTGLALAVATPLTPEHCVLLMGILSIVYCSMGGIEAVIWTDTLQTVALLGGAVLAFGFLISGVDGGFSGFLATAGNAGKFNLANMHLDVTARQIALWVIIVGGFAQNVSSYTADQAVVQRYMTTSDSRLAAKSIWTNAILAIPASILFFGIGTALFAYYHSNPERLDPAATTDQVFPVFISRELPAGLGGLLVAAVFAAAQSTVSTSMNSTATAIVTDFMRPLGIYDSDAKYLSAARRITILLGMMGTAFGLIFVDPEIRSLFDQFLKIIGLFMGVLGGLFVLGAFSTRANGTGALAGAITGATVMFCTWKYTSVNGYLYAAIGIATCVVTGYLVSLLTSNRSRDLEGLTIYTLNAGNTAVK